MNWMKYCALVVLVHTCSSEEEGYGVCEELEGCSSNGENAFSSGYSRWLNLINISMSSYSSCEEGHSGCGCFTPTISDDLEPWVQRGGVLWEMFVSARDLMNTVHYQILNHTLFRQPDCLFPSRCKGVEHFILQLLPTLPDMELVINTRDYPISSKRLHPLPIFSFSKTSGHYDIMYPAWSFWSGGPSIATEPRGLGRWDLKRESLSKASTQWPWSSKTNQGFFRGSRTSEERDPLVLLSREEPELVDAQYTKNQAWRSEKDTLGVPPASVVTMEHHCQYKYLFNFRGVTASFRLRHLFLCGSLVLHVGTEWEEFFYPSLRPWVHYVPLPDDLSNLREILEFLKAHDKTAKEIADRGFRHIWNQLDMDAVACYWKELLVKYAELCKWTVQKQESYVQLT